MNVAQQAHSGGSPVAVIIILVIAALEIIGMWLTFRKAGRHGWAAIVPIYNIYTMCKVAGRPGWWTVLYLIPVVNIVIAIVVAVDIARAFDKGAAFGVFLLWLLAVVGFLILGSGRATYHEPQRARR